MAATRFDDLSAPSDFGSAAPAPRSAPSRSPVEDATDNAPTTGQVTPEAVHYHVGEQRCDVCDHFSRGSQCSVLQMPVAPEDGCNAFRNGKGPAETDTDQDFDADMRESDAEYDV